MHVKYFDGIVPKVIDKEIICFCKKINYNKKPLYIDVLPAKGAIINECFINVDNFIKQNGGKCIYGWAIWLHPHCLLEAEFHAIYQSPDNHLIDITPHKNNLTKILFLEDSSLSYNGYSINNIRKNISKSKHIDECIAAWNELYNMLNTGKNKYKHGEILFENEEAQKICTLNEHIQYNLIEFYKNLKLKPNDTCICGSGLKFVDCCKHKTQY